MANEKRLILVDAHKLKETLTECFDEIKSIRPTRLPLMQTLLIWKGLCDLPTVDAVEVVHGHWEDGRCSNCKEEALSTSWDEPIYEYDWEENLRYSHTDTHTEYCLTDYCPYCGAKMDGDRDG